ncbi:MAG: hypothetical protein IK025_07995 [Bacteroidales bacterium]|nr:hypothetical protein [Bacteroidales bacterium]
MEDKFKALVAFTFHKGSADVGKKFVEFLMGDQLKGRKISSYNAEFQDQSTYGIEECEVDKLIIDIEEFCIEQLNEKNFNYNEDDFIRVFYANQDEYILMHEIKPSDIKDRPPRKSIENEPYIKRINKIMHRDEQ